MGFRTPTEVERFRAKQDAAERERATKQLRIDVEVALGKEPDTEGKRRAIIHAAITHYDEAVVSVIQAELAAAGWQTALELRDRDHLPSRNVGYLVIWPAPVD